MRTLNTSSSESCFIQLRVTRIPGACPGTEDCHCGSSRATHAYTIPGLGGYAEACRPACAQELLVDIIEESKDILADITANVIRQDQSVLARSRS